MSPSKHPAHLAPTFCMSVFYRLSFLHLQLPPVRSVEPGGRERSIQALLYQAIKDPFRISLLEHSPRISVTNILLTINHTITILGASGHIQRHIRVRLVQQELDYTFWLSLLRLEIQSFSFLKLSLLSFFSFLLQVPPRLLFNSLIYIVQQSSSL
jgi:hypothetical protein